MNLSLVRLSDVQPENVSWLWPGRIPAGKLVMLDGDPGLGKSTLALTIAATVTQGGAWPDGSNCEIAGDVLIMSAEDGVADTIVPRLGAAGADLDRVHHVEAHGHDGEPVHFSLANVVEIEDTITSVGAKLVVVDVLMAFLPGDAHKDQDVRKVLGPLAKVAERTGCTFLLLRHLNKTKGSDPVYRGGGSIGIVGAARVGLAVIADPDDPEVRVLTCVKNNLAAAGSSLAFTLVPATVDGVDTSRVEWAGEDVRTASELFAANADTDLGDISQQVIRFVDSHGTVETTDVAKALGITNKEANQYLNRLARRGSIVKLRRNTFASVKASRGRREDCEDGEDSQLANESVVGERSREQEAS